MVQAKAVMKRKVFFISDRTGITAETLGHSLLAQFEGIEFESIILPFVDSEAKALHAVEQINHANASDGVRPLVIDTLVDKRIRAIINQSTAFTLDFFNTFVGPLEQELGVASCYRMGRTLHTATSEEYDSRIEAINYTLANDDGANIRDYAGADLILLGVSRCGKTPTCLYLAMQFGIRAANYPLTEEDLEQARLPKFLQPYRNKSYGLTIDVERLQEIRSHRRPNSRYADLKQCLWELREADIMFRREQIPVLNTTQLSVEEIATKLIDQAGLSRHLA